MQRHAGSGDRDGAPTGHMRSRFRFWWCWLIGVTMGVLLLGISMVLEPGSNHQLLGLLLFASPDAITAFEAPAVSYITLVHGVLGAVLFGWGVALLFVLLGPFRRGAREGWLTFAVSIVAWFVPDTAFSLWTGFWQNAVLNGVMALAFAIPLAATYPRHASNPRP